MENMPDDVEHDPHHVYRSELSGSFWSGLFAGMAADTARAESEKANEGTGAILLGRQREGC